MEAPAPKSDALGELRGLLQPPLNINKEILSRRNRLEKFAVFITTHVGTMGFFLLILLWTAAWLGWNLLAPPRLQFDPPMGFVLWLFISNVIQLLLMPLIMVGQNIQGRYADVRAENDFVINVQAEKKIELVLHHLEYQNGVINEMAAQMRKDKSI